MCVAVRSAEIACALGDDLSAALQSFRDGASAHGPIRDRSLMAGRRYGAVSHLAVSLAKRALDASGLSREEIRHCALFAASSRGSSRLMNEATNAKRRVSRYAASNSLPAEIPAAVSIECGMEAGHFLISNGCSSGLDALAMAWRHLRAGDARHALIVAAELPLAPEIVSDFEKSGLLPEVTLSEGAAAVVLDADAGPGGWIIEAAAHRADAWNHLAQPADGGSLPGLLRDIIPTEPFTLCPHATGTRNNAAAERASLAGLPGDFELIPLKPRIGHTLGASGLLETALLTHLASRDVLVKWSTAMGGHHGAVRLRRHR